MTRTHRRLAAALLTAVAAGAVGLAQTPARPAEPAARLLPAQPVESGFVTRGYAPEPGTFADTRPPAKTATDQRSWTGAPLIADAQRPAPAPIPTDARRQPAPTPATALALPDARRQPAAPTQPQGPGFANGAAGVYAGPPAYRWYGYGTTTPGANPLAPAGQYPKGSANWYAQTGATPGAFPVPVTAGGEPVGRFEPPAYANVPPPPVATRPPTLPPTAVATTVPRDPRPAPNFNPPSQPLPAPRVAAAPVVPPATVAPPTVTPPAAAEPLRPSAEPLPIAVSTPAPVVSPPAAAKPALAPAPASAGGLSWHTAGPQDSLSFAPATPPVPIATSAAPAPAPPATPAEQPINFRPTLPAMPGASIELPPPAVMPLAPPATAPAAPAPATDWKAVPQARGQQPTDEAVSLTAQLRNSCYGLATVAQVSQTGPTSLVVRLTAATEDDARRAAAEAAKVPALRPYAVRFTVELPAR